ncbi:MAG: ribosome biogenesis GTPase Der [Candidatus Berkelbacteria bacterium]|nr:MAG: ribosome biogenesis GTPase Der [Candidatus Berkelbacteria bacterium]QQG52004.1 MAG: ribosome biogenesis GTPase Der [Candidatus Berkelbacteria bacterium]
MRKKSEDNLPLIALVGPTNAGKSTLFNRMTGSWQAITAREESTTRDRIYGEVEWQSWRFNLVDTGGLAEDESELYQKIKSQTLQAVTEADLVLFVFDATSGLTPSNLQFIKTLRQTKNVWLVANKMDSPKRRAELSTYDYLGLKTFAVSAIKGNGVGDLLEAASNDLPKVKINDPSAPVITIVGRPNVGKSTLLNSLTKSNRAVVSPLAGTTRDIVTEKIIIDGTDFLLADTAGVRRRGRIARGTEDFSVKRALTTISRSDAVLVVIDASEGTTRGDLHLIYFAHDLGKPLLIVINKMDLIETGRMPFHRYLHKFPNIPVSALKGENTDKVLTWLKENVASGK